MAKKLFNYREETKDCYANIQLELKIKDANGDKYKRDFMVMRTDEGLVLVCPDCGEWLNIDAENIACANGHMAYTVIEEDATCVINDTFRNAVEAYEESEKNAKATN